MCNLTTLFHSFEKPQHKKKMSTVCEVGDATINQSDLEILKAEKSWLNDNIITFYFEWLKRDLGEKSRNLVFIHPSAAYMLKILPLEELTCSVGRGSNPFLDAQKPETDIICVPVNDSEDPSIAGGSHWSLLIINKNDNIGYHYDSYYGHNDNVALKTLSCFNRLLFPINSSSQLKFEDAHSKQQQNGYDCGVYTLMNLLNIVVPGSIPEFSPEATVSFRKSLLNLVLKESEHYYNLQNS